MSRPLVVGGDKDYLFLTRGDEARIWFGAKWGDADWQDWNWLMEAHSEENPEWENEDWQDRIRLMEAGYVEKWANADGQDWSWSTEADSVKNPDWEDADWQVRNRSMEADYVENLRPVIRPPMKPRKLILKTKREVDNETKRSKHRL